MALQFVKGVGPQRAGQLERKGLRTVEDALFFVPLRHEDRTRLTPFHALVPGQPATCSGVIVGVSPPPPGRSRVPFTVMLRDASGYATASWFGWRYLTRVLKRGQRLVLHGRVGRYKGAMVIQQPDYEIVENGEDERLHTGRLVPVYSLTEGLPQRALRSLMWRLVDTFAAEVREVLPEGVRGRRALVGLAQAVRDAHFPESDGALAAARRRLAFDEGLLLQLGLAILRTRLARERGVAMSPRGDLVARLRAALPWKLTAAQQRARLRGKGEHPDLLVMTATPIPRTLALTIYGDLDISVLDELPPGRRPVVTVARAEGKRREIYKFLKEQVAAGRQIYVVYPLVEESEVLDLKAATDMARHLAKEIFPDLTVGLLHGRLGFEDKDAIMRRFKAGDIHVLVATTVIEVGIDVPNASVMLVEHAERFGLSQLHQLRGRVGRGEWKSYCILLTAGHLGEEAQRRIDAMTATNDGFRIAEVDLELRGPGEVFGTRQSGLPEFQAADLLRDTSLLEEARREASAIVARDRELSEPAPRALRAALLARWRGKLALATAG